MKFALGPLGFAVADNLGYSPDGGLVPFGELDYVYDSASRLTEVWSNGVRAVEYAPGPSDLYAGKLHVRFDEG